MGNLLVRGVLTAILALALFAATPALADDTGDYPDPVQPPTAAAMTFDALVVRPVSLVATVAGAGLFLVSLPFSAIGHNTDQAGHALVVDPARYTFTRPLGNFEQNASSTLDPAE